MKHHLNTLFVTIQDAYLAKEGQAVIVRHEKETRLRVPLHNLGGIVCFGRVGCSPALMGACAEAGVAISFMTEYGRLLARVVGFTSGNVLLRREQYRRADDPLHAMSIARNIVAAKVANSRSVLLRARRDHPRSCCREAIDSAVARLAQSLDEAQLATDTAVLRGVEGEAANTYFSAFNGLLTAQQGDFAFNGRSRRPPLDSINALLSFLYSMLMHDARSACEAAGLDPAVGFLHKDRPGRPSLALDLMEEFRTYLADRLAVSLINRQQIRRAGFTTAESGAVLMDDATRKTVLTAFQKRKQETTTHPFLNEKTTVGLLVHIQARLLARHLRGELDAYPPFLWK